MTVAKQSTRPASARPASARLASARLASARSTSSQTKNGVKTEQFTRRQDSPMPAWGPHPVTPTNQTIQEAYQFNIKSYELMIKLGEDCPQQLIKLKNIINKQINQYSVNPKDTKLPGKILTKSQLLLNLSTACYLNKKISKKSTGLSNTLNELDDVLTKKENICQISQQATKIKQEVSEHYLQFVLDTPNSSNTEIIQGICKEIKNKLKSCDTNLFNRLTELTQVLYETLQTPHAAIKNKILNTIHKALSSENPLTKDAVDTMALDAKLLTQYYTTLSSFPQRLQALKKDDVIHEDLEKQLVDLTNNNLLENLLNSTSVTTEFSQAVTTLNYSIGQFETIAELKKEAKKIDTSIFNDTGKETVQKHENNPNQLFSEPINCIENKLSVQQSIGQAKLFLTKLGNHKKTINCLEHLKKSANNYNHLDQKALITEIDESIQKLKEFNSTPEVLFEFDNDTMTHYTCNKESITTLLEQIEIDNRISNLYTKPMFAETRPKLAWVEHQGPPIRGRKNPRKGVSAGKASRLALQIATLFMAATNAEANPTNPSAIVFSKSSSTHRPGPGSKATPKPGNLRGSGQKTSSTWENAVKNAKNSGTKDTAALYLADAICVINKFNHDQYFSIKNNILNELNQQNGNIEDSVNVILENDLDLSVPDVANCLAERDSFNAAIQCASTTSITLTSSPSTTTPTLTFTTTSTTSTTSPTSTTSTTTTTITPTSTTKTVTETSTSTTPTTTTATTTATTSVTDTTTDTTTTATSTTTTPTTTSTTPTTTSPTSSSSTTSTTGTTTTTTTLSTTPTTTTTTVTSTNTATKTTTVNTTVTDTTTGTSTTSTTTATSTTSPTSTLLTTGTTTTTTTLLTTGTTTTTTVTSTNTLTKTTTVTTTVTDTTTGASTTLSLTDEELTNIIKNKNIMELYRLPNTDSIDTLVEKLGYIDIDNTPAGRRLSDENENDLINEAFNALLDLISDENLQNKLKDLSTKEKTDLLSRLKTNIKNIHDIKDQKDILGHIAFVLMLISLTGRLGIDRLRQFDYEATPVVRVILNFLDEASLITASSSDNLNIDPGLVALAAQIAISIISLKNPDHKYKNSLATLGPVIPLLVLDYFINNSVSNNSLSYLMSNFFSVGVEMRSIKIAEARAAAEAEARAVAPAAAEAEARAVAPAGSGAEAEARAVAPAGSGAEAEARAVAPAGSGAASSSSGLGAASSSSGLGGTPAGDLSAVELSVEEVKSDAAAEAVISASEILNRNINTDDIFLLNIGNFNYQKTKNQVLENLNEAIAIKNLPGSFKRELQKIKEDENHNIIDQSIIDQNFRSKMYREYLLHKHPLDGNFFHLNMINFEKVIQALKNLAPPNTHVLGVLKKSDLAINLDDRVPLWDPAEI